MASPLSLVDKWQKAIAPLKFTGGNQVDYLIDGLKTFKAMYDAIMSSMDGENTKDNFIYILGWWLEDTVELKADDPRSTLKSLLSQASEKNVQIRVILWDNLFQFPHLVGPFNKNSVKNIRNLKNAVGLLDTHPISKWGSHHQKILIVKNKSGLIGFCGGVDISSDRINYVKNHPGSPYHDVHCKIQGDGVIDLLSVFVKRWNAHPNHELWDNQRGALIGIPEKMPKKGVKIGNQYVAIATTFNSLKNGMPCAVDRSIKETIFNVIDTAVRFIYIEDQYLVSLEIAKKLQQRLSKIQHLTILIPHSDISDLPNVRTARARFIAILQKDPVQYNKKVHIFYRFSKGSTKLDFPHNYVHSKTWIVDDEIALIGSANCNERGLSYDSEVMAAIFDKPAEISPKNYSFAQDLRIKLWIEHLGLSESGMEVTNGFIKQSQEYWTTPKNKDNYSVRSYELSGVPENSPQNVERNDFDTTVDHSFDTIPAPFENVSPDLYNALIDISGENFKACK